MLAVIISLWREAHPVNEAGAAPLMPRPEPLAFARHEQSSGLFVSGLSHPDANASSSLTSFYSAPS